MGDGNNIVLDHEAQRLFEQLGGLQAYNKTQPAAGGQRLAQSMLDEQKRHDAIRVLMLQATWLLGRYLADERYAGPGTQEPKVFQKLVAILAKLARTPGHLGFMLIRYRGTSSAEDFSEKFDYEVVFGHTMVDSRIVPHMARRNGPQWAKLPDQLLDAFRILADYGVNNIFIRLPEQNAAEMSNFQFCLKILSGFRVCRHTGTPIRIDNGSEKKSIPLINDENLFPDPNLTMLSGLNGLSPEAMATLVEKVDRWLRRKEVTSTATRYAGVYNAALGLPKIGERFVRPTLELNNVKWLITETEDQVISVEKAHIAKLAVEMAGASPQKVAKMIQSVYGEDYAVINKFLLGERLHLSSNLIDAAEKRTKEPELANELLGNLQVRLDLVKDRVIDEIHVVEDTGAERAAGKEPPLEAVHSQIYRMVSFFKGRSGTRKKMVGMVNQAIEFSARDYEILAKDFKISTEDAQALVRKLKSCFGPEGNFKKSFFAEAVPHFRRYEQKIFHFLWHHMKDVVQPQDRAAFLNSLQALTTQMEQPKKAMKILLEDLYSDPSAIQFSDNKALMLGSLIIHRDKSLTDYDMTPEDIVLSRHNIEAEAAQYAAWRIEKDQEAFSTKVQTLHKKMTEGLQLGHSVGQNLPAAILLNLERELYIFLSLLECDTGKAILRSAANEYGDPTAEIYHQKESENFLGPLMQNLRVTIRGVGSVGTTADIPALETIKTREEDFRRLKNDRNHRTQARLITEWVDEAVKIIKFRC